MAQKLEETQGIVDDVNYLNGKVVDGETLCGAHVNQDIIQFFQKLLEEAGITANGLDDNQANGYQFISALLDYIQTETTNRIAHGGTAIGGTDDYDLMTSLGTQNFWVNKFNTYFKTLTTKIIDIGVWDMYTNESHNVDHLLSATEWNTIKTIEVMISTDSGFALRRLDCLEAASTINGGVQYISDTKIYLLASRSGIFDSPSFGSTSINRGSITIQYRAD